MVIIENGDLGWPEVTLNMHFTMPLFGTRCGIGEADDSRISLWILREYGPFVSTILRYLFYMYNKMKNDFGQSQRSKIFKWMEWMLPSDLDSTF